MASLAVRYAVADARRVRKVRIGGFYTDQVSADRIRQVSIADGVSISDYQRALFDLLIGNEDLHQTARERAEQIHREDRIRRYGEEHTQAS